jgi:hypothetical protein
MWGSSYGPIYDTIPVFPWSDWGKPWQISVRIASIQAEIWKWGNLNKE